MSGHPRNPRAVEAGLEHRQQIRAAMLDHGRRHPLSRPLTGEQMQALFPNLSLSTIYWHMGAIAGRLRPRRPSMHCNFSNS